MSSLSPTAHTALEKRWQRAYKSQNLEKTISNQRLPGTSVALMNSQLWLSAQYSRSSQPTFHMCWGGNHKIPSVAEELQTVEGYWEREIDFFLQRYGPSGLHTLPWLALLHFCAH